MKLLKPISTILLSLASIFSSLAFDGAYYGTNYTVPFAHAYRALDYIGVDHKDAINRDVYHMSRLGLNAFRLHLWDVELSDADGNLIQNSHLDLLDYLISTLESRGISIILTAQTNFGNGYPERNSDPYGAFSYRYDKCCVHDDATAIAAQQRYIKALATHINPYTNLSYAADPAILAVEINNEPCHSGTQSEITGYINGMVQALRSSGWDKDILYNVSHNLEATQAFYDADIDGTTFQWYPIGLVSGHERHGNFLPMLDNYNIPFHSIQGYDNRSRIIYEYDPADVLATYLYPAAARTFRKAGFDWVTQFAYDPIDIAAFNTEYQTHYLNLAYTPGKAVGMAIAAEATRRLPKGADYGKYPADTIFENFLVSSRRNLAMFNDGQHFFHTNSTTVAPVNVATLASVVGVGSSPIVSTDGSGAYFIDKLSDGVWRLEVMPDVVLTADPFAKPSLSRKVGYVLDSPINLSINLPGLNSKFKAVAIDGNLAAIASEGSISVKPGVYILSNKGVKVDANASYGNGYCKMGEYVAPTPSLDKTFVIHTPAKRVEPRQPMRVEATVISPELIDSVVLYPASASFWSDHNHLYPMEKVGKYQYAATIDGNDIYPGSFGYNIVVYLHNGTVTTYPSEQNGTPLSWDYNETATNYSVQVATDEIVPLFTAMKNLDGIEISTIPDQWNGISIKYNQAAPKSFNSVGIEKSSNDSVAVVLTKYVGDLIKCYPNISDNRRLYIRTTSASQLDSISIGLINGDGFTYSAKVKIGDDGIASVDLADLELSNTFITPAPYPVFMQREFIPDAASATPLHLNNVVSLNITIPPTANTVSAEIVGVWIQ